MASQHLARMRCDVPATYRITVQGRLGAEWSRRLGDMAIATQCQPDVAPVTTLTGPLLDQAALAGVLSAVFDLGLVLLSVEQLAVLDSGAAG